MADPFKEGRDAYADGLDLNENPHVAGGAASVSWEKGWLDDAELGEDDWNG